MTILGISLGTKRTGIAVLKDGVLLDRRIHNFQPEWSEKKKRAIINKIRQYMLKYPITDIVVKIPPTQQHSKALRQLLKRIQTLADKCECALDYTTKLELKSITGMTSTDELVKYTALLYPELYHLFDRGIDINHSYYKKLFEAVLSAHMHEERKPLHKG